MMPDVWQRRTDGVGWGQDSNGEADNEKTQSPLRSKANITIPEKLHSEHDSMDRQIVGTFNGLKIQSLGDVSMKQLRFRRRPDVCFDAHSNHLAMSCSCGQICYLQGRPQARASRATPRAAKFRGPLEMPEQIFCACYTVNKHKKNNIFNPRFVEFGN
jgi:hypothetical protein